MMYIANFQVANNAKIHIRTPDSERVKIQKNGNKWGGEYVLTANENFKVAVISSYGEVICQFWATKTYEETKLF